MIREPAHARNSPSPAGWGSSAQRQQLPTPFTTNDRQGNLPAVKPGRPQARPTHILNGNVIAATPVNFFSQEWFEETFGLSMVETALARTKQKSEVRRD
ncbi:hypothetical protein POJ06DRAFT_268533 [Lipomyces tetrasporus]|uniref:Uncharacterized protein n=1 Tax=Lipomyces tetrasporus TaxID=54092 RepID=A0AAD7QQX5_9ASCO|nr:uncharacterized protein POJ06DRAFT_268533 [Lipomyces tetrasporus]KAJ8099648.1 hypothetical protein POJ06DRAFT_268533 [Lipomyces tetrasporus]